MTLIINVGAYILLKLTRYNIILTVLCSLIGILFLVCQYEERLRDRSIIEVIAYNCRIKGKG